MFTFIRKIFKTDDRRSHIPGTDSVSDSKVAAIGKKSNLDEPKKSRHEVKVTRALHRKARRMKLERILEKTVKRR
jgi:hypothetical protein